MKILQVTHHTAPCVGGIEKYVMELSLQLKKKGHEVEVLCLDRCPNSKEKLPAEETINGIKIHRIPFVDLKYYKVAPSVLKFTKDFDVLHVQNIGFFSDFLALTKLLHRKKVVVNTHGGFFHTKKFSLLKKIYFYTLNNLSLHLCNAVLVDSKNDEEIFRKILGNKTQVMGLGVDLVEYLKIKSNPDNARMLYIGRLSRNKGLGSLLDVVAIAAKSNPKIKLVLLGKDFDGTEALLKEKIMKLGIEKNVELLGEVSHQRKMEEISKARFCVSASEYEGFGIAVIEQMAAGNIPLLNDIPNFRWFVRDGKSGFVFNFRDADLARDKITKAMKMPAKELDSMSGEARKDAMRFEWNNVIREIEKAYAK
jgi:alpha-1,3-mannosyltransferase